MTEDSLVSSMQGAMDGRVGWFGAVEADGGNSLPTFWSTMVHYGKTGNRFAVLGCVCVGGVGAAYLVEIACGDCVPIGPVGVLLTRAMDASPSPPLQACRWCPSRAPTFRS